MYTPIFTTALYTIAMTWKQPKCPSTEEWIKKRWHTYTQWNTNQPWKGTNQCHLQMWIGLETVIQTEVSQKEKIKYCIILHICGIQKYGNDGLICKAEIQRQLSRNKHGYQEGKKGWNALADWDWHIHTTIYKIGN